jgi:hypothetical protein
MTLQQDALIGLATFLDAARVPYMIIGGMANIVWGEPRATIDIDVTVWVPEREVPTFVGQLGESYRILIDAPLPFIAATRVLPVETASGVRIDVILGLLPFEQEAIDRARPVEVAGAVVRFCTPEDLVLMKIISDRERDLTDARAVLARRGDDLDLDYLEPRIIELARLLDRDDIAQRWAAWKAETRRT